MEPGGVARLLGAVTALAAILNCPATALSNGRPHIIFIVADDLGWNDVSWHNPQIISPNLGRLAREGVILNSSYVQQVCSPSRSAFMAGRFPYHTGLQHGVIRPLSPHGLSLNFTLLPQKLKEVGYSTHGVGKWHLGFCKWEYTPTRRGFDTYVGYLLGAEDYFYHTRDYDGSGRGYDFRYNTSVYTSANGTYSAHVFGQRAVEIIKGHDPATPLFLYLPFQSVHQPLQVPQKYEDMYPNIKNVNRRKFCGMVTAMDEAVGNITSALEQTGLIDNALIIFTTDNGGPIVGSANNWPLRGAKATLWEGGNKGSAFVYSKNLFSKTGYTNTEMIHAVDWYPTLLHLAGAQPEPGIDGVNQWDTLRQGAPSARTEFVYNIDDLNNNSAIRMGKYKLIKGVAGLYNGWYPPPTLVDTPNDITLFFRPGPDTYRLFDIDDDPTEHFDLASKLPDVLAKMKARLMEYRKTMVPADDPPSDHRGDPGNFGGFWSPGWC